MALRIVLLLTALAISACTHPGVGLPHGAIGVIPHRDGAAPYLCGELACLVNGKVVGRDELHLVGLYPESVGLPPR